MSVKNEPRLMAKSSSPTPIMACGESVLLARRDAANARRRIENLLAIIDKQQQQAK